MDGLTGAGDVFNDWGPKIYARYKHFNFPVQQEWLENYLSEYAKSMAEKAREQRFGSDKRSSASAAVPRVLTYTEDVSHLIM